MKSFLKDWWSELAMFLLGAILLILGVQLDLVKGLGPTDIAGVLAAVVAFSAAAISFSNKVELRQQMQQLESRTVAQMRAESETLLRRLLDKTDDRIQLLNKDEFFDYKAQRVNSTQRSIFTTEFNDISSTPFSGHPAQKRYSQFLRAKLKSDNFTYRRVEFIESIEQLELLTKTIGENSNSRFYIGGYAKGALSSMPFLEFMVFDDSEVIIGGYRGPDWTQGEYNIVIRDARAVKMFLAYADLLFDRSIKLNGPGLQSSDILNDNIARLQVSLATKPSQTVTVLKDRVTVYECLFRDLKASQSETCMISDEILSSMDERRHQYYAEIKSSMQRGVMHRRIIWNKDHLQWIRGFLNGDDNNDHLQVRFYDERQYPKLSTTFDLIDKQTAVLLYGCKVPWVAIVTDADIVEMLAVYFERIWALAEANIIMQYPNKVNWDVLDRLEQTLGIQRSE